MFRKTVVRRLGPAVIRDGRSRRQFEASGRPRSFAGERPGPRRCGPAPLAFAVLLGYRIDELPDPAQLRSRDTEQTCGLFGGGRQRLNQERLRVRHGLRIRLAGNRVNDALGMGKRRYSRQRSCDARAPVTSAYVYGLWPIVQTNLRVLARCPRPLCGCLRVAICQAPPRPVNPAMDIRSWTLDSLFRPAFHLQLSPLSCFRA